MAENESKFEVKKEDIINLVSSEGFSNLSYKMQEKVINSIGGKDEIDGGVMGKFFGNKKENAAMHIAFAVCLLLAVVGVICMWSGHDIWDVVIPAIMAAVGYMFGVGSKNG